MDRRAEAAPVRVGNNRAGHWRRTLHCARARNRPAPDPNGQVTRSGPTTSRLWYIYIIGPSVDMEHTRAKLKPGKPRTTLLGTAYKIYT